MAGASSSLILAFQWKCFVVRTSSPLLGPNYPIGNNFSSVSLGAILCIPTSSWSALQRPLPLRIYCLTISAFSKRQCCGIQRSCLMPFLSFKHSWWLANSQTCEPDGKDLSSGSLVRLP